MQVQNVSEMVMVKIFSLKLWPTIVLEAVFVYNTQRVSLYAVFVVWLVCGDFCSGVTALVLFLFLKSVKADETQLTLRSAGCLWVVVV